MIMYMYRQNNRIHAESDDVDWSYTLVCGSSVGSWRKLSEYHDALNDMFDLIYPYPYAAWLI
jgi:hypothetical protein